MEKISPHTENSLVFHKKVMDSSIMTAENTPLFRATITAV